MNPNKYFELPVFESRKSSSSLRYRNEFEKSLMKFFDDNPEIANYFQPLMGIPISGQSEETVWLHIDFWLDCKNGKTILVHLADEDSLKESGKLLGQTKPFCRDDNFELMILRSSDNHLTPINQTVQAKLFEG